MVDVDQMLTELKTDITNDFARTLDTTKKEIEASLDKKLKKLSDVLTKKGSGLVTRVSNLEKSANKQNSAINKKFKSLQESLDAHEADLVDLHVELDDDKENIGSVYPQK